MTGAACAEVIIGVVWLADRTSVAQAAASVPRRVGCTREHKPREKLLLFPDLFGSQLNWLSQLLDPGMLNCLNHSQLDLGLQIVLG